MLSSKVRGPRASHSKVGLHGALCILHCICAGDEFRAILTTGARAAQAASISSKVGSGSCAHLASKLASTMLVMSPVQIRLLLLIVR